MVEEESLAAVDAEASAVPVPSDLSWDLIKTCSTASSSVLVLLDQHSNAAAISAAANSWWWLNY